MRKLFGSVFFGRGLVFRGTAFAAAMACLAVPTIVLGSPAGSVTAGSLRTNILNGVSCLNATTCVAVGTTYVGGNVSSSYPYKTLAGRWDGKTFSVMPTPNAPGTQSSLSAVSCPSKNNCFAVGQSVDTKGNKKALAERWNGSTWSIVAAPTLTFTALNSVSCTSVTFCFAVGQGAVPAGALLERWNGRKWSVVTSPKPGGSPAELESVTCVSTTNCSAVGDYSSSFTYEALPLFEHWDGKKWSIVAGTAPTAPDPRLTGVACANAAACVALGSADTGILNNSAPWTAHGNGQSWTLAPPASVTAKSSALTTAACSGGTNCFAVGSFDNATNGEPQPHPLVERWNGTAWAFVAPAHTATAIGGWFNSVSCKTATTCLAVGSSVTLINTGGFYRQHTLIERWNGKAWSIVKSP